MLFNLTDKKNNEGKTRIVRRFALSPKYIRIDGKPFLIWLQHYYSHEIYQYWCDPSCGAEGFTWYIKDRSLSSHPNPSTKP